MAREFLDFDPFTGIATYTEDLDGPMMAIHQETDVEPLIEAVKRRRLEGFSDMGIGRTLNGEYCRLDCVTIMNLKKKGIDVFAKMPNGSAEQARFMREIETNYPYLKTTEKKGWRPAGSDTARIRVIRSK